MRNLKYAILCLLRRGPLTGYDITKEFSKALGIFWTANHSQIYPELKKLVGEGLITYQTVLQGEKLQKKLYTITDEGIAQHTVWMDEPTEMEPTPKDIFRLKAFFMDAWTEEQCRGQYNHQLAQRREKLAFLQGIFDDNYIGAAFEDLTAEQKGDYLVLRGAILREGAYAQWLEESLELLKE